MRHRRKINHLSRKSAHRKAMMANMASSLILHKRIHTTLAKAKALRTYVEPLITKSKLSVTTKTSAEEASHLRRVVFSYLQNKEAVTELFRDVSAKVAERPGGYTRIIKTGTRLGDNAEMCMMELVDYNENLLQEKAGAESKSKRRRRGGKKKAEETTAGTAAAATTATAVEDTGMETVTTEDPAAGAEETKAPVEDKLHEEMEAPAEKEETGEEEVKEEENKPEAKTEDSTEAKGGEPVQENQEEAPEKDDEEKKDDSEKKGSS